MGSERYLLANLSSPDKLLPAAQQIEKLSPSARWEAVDGSHHLVIKLNGNDDITGSIGKIDGINELAVCDILNDSEPNNLPDPDLARSYLFIETAADKQDDVIAAMTAMPSVVSCSPVKGPYSVIGMIVGERFDDIDRVINRDIVTLDGALRVKQDRVINLDRM